MAAQKDSSVLFSLQELMGLEQDRVRQEELERERQAHAATQARVAAEQRARDDEEVRRRAAEAERRAAEERARAEAARLEALRLAELERARIEAENAGRLEAMRRQQEHERALMGMKEASGKKKRTLIVAGLGVLLVAASVFGGFKIHETREAAATAQAEASRLQQQIQDIDVQKRRIESEQKDLKGKSAEDIRRLEDQLRELQLKQDQLKKVGPGPKPGNVAPAAPPKPKNANCQKRCDPGDPLCVEC